MVLMYPSYAYAVTLGTITAFSQFYNKPAPQDAHRTWNLVLQIYLS